MALTGVLARRIAAFKNAEAPSISRLGYLHPPLTPRPRSDVIPVTGSEKVTAIKVMVMSFTFCIMPAKSSSSPTREQRSALSLESRWRAIRPKPNDSFQDRMSILQDDE